MDEGKKAAYKKLIYQALLDIKNSGSYREESHYRNLRIAHAFHNLAKSFVQDFTDFDEESFWSSIDALENQFQSNHYKQIFLDSLKNASQSTDS